MTQYGSDSLYVIARRPIGPTWQSGSPDRDGVNIRLFRKRLF